MNNDIQNDLPTVESGGLDDRTIASPALGYGQERIDMLYEEPPTPRADAGETRPTQDLLHHNDVAAVNVEHPYYVSDVPSPYLSERLAQEDVVDTRRREGVIRGILVTLLVVVLLVASAWAIVHALPVREVQDVPQYKTTPIERREFLDTVDATVLVEPIDSRTVTAGVSGNLQQAYVSVGTQVYEGDTVFSLENKSVTDSFNRAQELYDDAVERSEEKAAKLKEADDAVASSQAAVDAATQDTERIVAEAALTTAKTLQQAAQTEYDAAEATLQTVTETFEHARSQQEALSVRSPITGTVTEVNDTIRAGTAVSSSVQLCTVSDLSSYALRVQIPGERRAMAEEGQEVRITFPEIEDLSITSTISSIEDTESLSVATVTIENPDERIQVGMQAQVSLVLQSVDDSLIVPIETVTYDENGDAHLSVLLDPTRGISTDVVVNVIAQSATEAAVSAENIQEGNAIIIPKDE